MLFHTNTERKCTTFTQSLLNRAYLLLSILQRQHHKNHHHQQQQQRCTASFLYPYLGDVPTEILSFGLIIVSNRARVSGLRFL